MTAVTMVLMCVACGDSSGPARPFSAPATVSVEVVRTAHEEQTCGDGFRVMELPHVVEIQDAEEQFDANGAGVAIADVDGDDLPDVVFGSLDGPLRLFRNRGGLDFEAEDLADLRARAVQLVDVDADDDLDIVVAPGLDPPVLLVNDGGSFRPSVLPGVQSPAYSMVWLDPDDDSDLDLVTAAYDMEFGRVVAREFVNDREEGVWFHMQQADGTFTSSQLAETSNALAMTTVDLDDDGRAELIVGNDFGLPDAAWSWDNGWQPLNDPFTVTTANTMSFDVGDVDRDGDEDVYATDMAPYDGSNELFWQFMADHLVEPPGPQTIRNVMLDLGAGEREDSAGSRGIEATGWSWAGRLLDLDNDADLDLYVANGMLPSPLMPDELGDELVESNQAFSNDGTGAFSPADQWGLDLIASTRGLAAGDLDGDGDLDLAASTVSSPALLLINELCDGPSVTIEPRWSGQSVVGTTVNLRPTGSQVVVQSRTIRSGAGYLSADEPIAHFGVDQATSFEAEVRWPGGMTSVVEGINAGTRIVVAR